MAFPSITSPAKAQHSAWPIWWRSSGFGCFYLRAGGASASNGSNSRIGRFKVQAGLLYFPPFELSLRMLFQVSTTPLLVFLPTGTRRHSSLPLIPNLSEYGYSSFWLGLAVPQGTPDAIVKCLNLAVNNAFKNLFSKTALRAKYGPCWEADPKPW